MITISQPLKLFQVIEREETISYGSISGMIFFDDLEFNTTYDSILGRHSREKQRQQRRTFSL